MNNYIQKVFNKSYEEITLEDIENFFKTPQEETSILEFKKGDVEINKIFEEVAAFHNTEGGLLIIGAPEEKKETIGKKNHVKRCAGDLTYSPFQNKDWILQKLGSNIVPFPTGIKIKEFHKPQGAVYLIDIPQSTNPPHQCSSDGRYYIRIDNEAKPAPHGFVQAMFQKRKTPILIAKLSFSNRNENSFQTTVEVENTSNMPGEKVGYDISLFNIVSVTGNDFIKSFHLPNLPRFEFQYEATKILVRRMAMQKRFRITFKAKYILIGIAIWCKTCDIKFHYYIVNTATQSIDKEYDDEGGDKQHEVFDEYLNLIKITM